MKIFNKSLLTLSLLFFSEFAFANKLSDCSRTLVNLMLAKGNTQKTNQEYCAKKSDHFRECSGVFIEEKKLNVAEQFLMHLKEAELAEFTGECSKNNEEKISICNSSLAGLFTDFKIPGSSDKVAEKLREWPTISDADVKVVKSLIMTQLERSGISQFAKSTPEGVRGGPTIQGETRRIVSIRIENETHQAFIKPDGSVELKDLNSGKTEHSCTSAAPRKDVEAPKAEGQN